MAIHRVYSLNVRVPYANGSADELSPKKDAVTIGA